MDVAVHIVIWLNTLANAFGQWVLAPIAILPGWLAATLVGVATGLIMLIAFKYTSNQRAIKAVRDDIKANLFAVKLFKESARVALRAQGGILLGAGRLLLHAIVPMLIMAAPMTLLLIQLALWYQARPLRIGEETVVTLKLNEAQTSWPKVSLQSSAADVTAGPVRVLSKRELCWNIKARANGMHRLIFYVDGQPIEKELAVGDGFMRVSTQRPGWSWSDAIIHPAEPPLERDGAVASIEIAYPTRPSWVSGTNTWVVYWFGVSLVTALACRRLFRVNL